jgi:predicted nucleic acid-binding protein
VDNVRDSVVSDSSFYIAFLSPDEINDPETLAEILQKYEFFLGKVVLNEVTEKHSDLFELMGFGELVNILERYDYSVLLSIIGDKIFKKGEYECIAIAYQIYKKLELHSLILDDNPARRFVENNIPELHPFVKYSLRFIVNCCCSEQKLSAGKTLIVLNKVKQAIKNGSRPFNLTERNIAIVDQLLNEVNECQKLNFTRQ